MKFFKLFLIVFCILLFSRSTKLQNATTINYNSSIKPANDTNVLTNITTVPSTINNNPTKIPTNGPTTLTYITTVSTTINNKPTNIPTNASTANNYNPTSKATNSTNVSIYLTTAAFALTNSPTITGQYRSRVKILCSFNDTFLQDYYNSKSQIFYSYLLNIFSKISAALPNDIIRLRRLVVYSAKPGSVVVNMRADLLSVVALNDSMLMYLVQKAISTAFKDAKIIEISVALSSTPVKSTTNSSWVAGLVILIVLAIIFIVVAILLFNRYFPGKCCRVLKKTNASTTNTTSGNFELEYDNRYHDKYPIVD